jgi:2-oxoglutarate ferredoxin oxidoreductase subunit alpha
VLPAAHSRFQQCFYRSIQPAQQDYLQATKALGHGDGHAIVLAPNSVQEIATLVGEAFDLADIYRMPCMILADGALGQMMEPVDFEAKPAREIPEKDWACCGHGGKRVHNIVNSLYIEPEVLEKTVLERFEKYKHIEENEVKYEEYLTEDADIVVAAFGIAARVARSAVNEARKQGIKVGMIRPITLWPFPKAPFEKAVQHAKAFVSVELSMGQMIEDVRLATECKVPVTLCNRAGGMIPSPEQVLESIKQAANGGAK